MSDTITTNDHLEGKATVTPPFLGSEVEERLKAAIAGDALRANAARLFVPHASVWLAAYRHEG